MEEVFLITVIVDKACFFLKIGEFLVNIQEFILELHREGQYYKDKFKSKTIKV